MRHSYPSDVVSISKTVNPLNYDVTAIVKHLGALKKFPVLIFEHPLNAHGRATEMKLVIGAENAQKKIQVALGLRSDMNRAEMALSLGARASSAGRSLAIRKSETAEAPGSSIMGGRGL